MKELRRKSGAPIGEMRLLLHTREMLPHKLLCRGGFYAWRREAMLVGDLVKQSEMPAGFGFSLAHQVTGFCIRLHACG